MVKLGYTAIGRVGWQIRLSARECTRRYGWLGWALMLSAILDLGFWQLCREQERRVDSLTVAIAESKLNRTPVQARASGLDRLAAFDAYLPAHDEIPGVVGDLLRMAEDQQLSILRGDYRAQIDEKGRFLRYQMALPVKGDSQAIYRFMQTALRQERTLALEGVQFKRELINSAEIEARIQWTLITQLPQSSSATSEIASARAGSSR